MYTPIKRAKHVHPEDLEQTVLFGLSSPLNEPGELAEDEQTGQPAVLAGESPSDDEDAWPLPQMDPLEEIEAPATRTGSVASREPARIPNSQWWEESSPPSLVPGADETIDTDPDTDTDGVSTQHYLREILTESMVESLPLPPQQKLQARSIISPGRERGHFGGERGHFDGERGRFD